MHSKKLPVYLFDNGSKVCKASLYNLYEVLKLLGILHREDKTYETMCWVRDYAYSYTIETAEQLEYLLLNEKTRLRISFFSGEINSIQELIDAAKKGELPIVDEHPSSYSSPVRHKELYVYTIWFTEGRIYDTPYLSKSKIKNINTLFDNVRSAYQLLYARPLLDKPPEMPDIDRSNENLYKNFATIRTTSDGNSPIVEPIRAHFIITHILDVISSL